MDLENLLEAYQNCLRNKRRRDSSVSFQLQYWKRLPDLCERINKREYYPSRSICFIVTRPRYREVFAASFEDRIIHHWIALRLEPLFESVFSPRVYNCRVGKGQLYGVERLKEDIRECSNLYTEDCYIAKLDIKGFFMSINKPMLSEMIDKFIVDNYTGKDIDDLRYLCKVVILHNPEKNCERHSPVEMWKHIPDNKSLFTNGDALGIAIGNLFSQLFANYLLNELDWLLVKNLGFEYVGRYVDDFYIIDKDKSRILESIPSIRDLLSSLGLTLHPNKFYIQHYSKGVEFTGNVVKLDRVYICNRTINNFSEAVRCLNLSRRIREIRHYVSCINSYLGILGHCNEYASKRNIIDKISDEKYKYIFIKGDYNSVSIKNKYKKRSRTFEIIKNGKW